MDKVKNLYYTKYPWSYWTWLILELEDWRYMKQQSTDIVEAFWEVSEAEIYKNEKEWKFYDTQRE